MANFEKTRFRRDLYYSVLTTLGFALAITVVREWNVFVVAAIVFPVVWIGYKVARRLRFNTHTDLLFEQENVPDHLPERERNLKIFKQGMDRLEAQQSDREKRFLFVITVLFFMFVIVWSIKFIKTLY